LRPRRGTFIQWVYQLSSPDTSRNLFGQPGFSAAEDFCSAKEGPTPGEYTRAIGGNPDHVTDNPATQAGLKINGNGAEAADADANDRRPGMGLIVCCRAAESSCGMTTSFSWFVRGNLLASLYVQPMGMALAMITACCVWGGSYVAATGRPVYRLLRLLPGRYYLFPLLALGVLAWGWKILIHLNGLDGWR
jgi:hypothetical protein